MQTLGLSDSTPRTDSRLKSLSWPSIKTSSDVDYLGSQGLWVCSAIGVLSFIVLAFTGKVILGLFILLLYYLSGVGVREGSRYAVGWAFATYFGDMIITGPHVVKMLYRPCCSLIFEPPGLPPAGNPIPRNLLRRQD